MLTGYAMTGTVKKIAGIEPQGRELLANGCERIIKELLLRSVFVLSSNKSSVSCGKETSARHQA
jgi:hypothetical protein